MRVRLFTLASMLLLSICASAQDNAELVAMFAEDQADRRSENIDWSVVSARDAERRAAVMSILASGEIRTAQDYYNAAMIFQHGDSEAGIRLAHSFASIAAALRGTNAANWLKAASWDRLMLRFEQPQWYGTQYVQDDSGRWMLYEVDSDVITDEQRAAWSVPSLEGAQSRAAIMNGER